MGEGIWRGSEAGVSGTRSDEASSSWRSIGSGVRSQSSGGARHPGKGRSLLREGGRHEVPGFIAKHRSVRPAAWLCEALWRIEVWLPCLAGNGVLRALAGGRGDHAHAVRTSFLASKLAPMARTSDLARCAAKQAFRCGLRYKIERLMRAQALAGAAGTQARPAERRRRIQPQQSRRKCSTASSRRTSPTANGLPISRMA